MEAFSGGARAGGSSDETQLFAQALLGGSIPSQSVTAAELQRDRERLEWLSAISPKHADELRRLHSADAERRHRREQLEWLATISEDHARQLRALLREEADESDAPLTDAGRRTLACASGWYDEQGDAQASRERQLATQEDWNPAKHPRRGTAPNAGWFATTAGGSSSSGSAGSSSGGGGVFSVPDAVVADEDRAPAKRSDSAPAQRPDDAGDAEAPYEPPHAMLELAHAWHQTKKVHDQIQRDLKELPGRIADMQSNLGRGGNQAFHQGHYLAQAKHNLATAKALAPDVKQQLADLEQAYHDSGYDDLEYAAWTPGETRIGGRGIADVGRAVSDAGTPAGMRPTGIEVDLISAALAGPAILRLGKAALKSATTVATRKRAAAVDDFVAKLPWKRTPAKKGSGRYEIQHAGDRNYKLTGGGESFDMDGYRGNTILEAKYVGAPKDSPYVPASSCPEFIRNKVLEDTRDELRRLRTIILSRETPFKSVEIITNTAESKSFFESLLEELGVPGIVRVEP